ncbi:non-ribosomal peptide synthetase [Catenulispora subtropica]|uniref:Carrier domain-containing protein n=1 Tax=Catenulispora subtropica TaxID=450798 RepID=A0ABN2SMC6_9ACTN
MTVPAPISRPAARDLAEQITAAYLTDRWVEQTPDAVAVVADGATMTYRELDARANRLARFLRDHSGVRRGDAVGIAVSTGLGVPVAILAVLRAGGFYVPLDPVYPRDRLNFMLADSRCRAVLAQDTGLDWIDPSSARVIPIDAPTVATCSAERLPEVAEADDLAYVIYTSGSTGIPKAVAITHRNLVYSTAARVEYYGSGPRTLAMTSSIAFDSSVAGIFWTLAEGGALFLPPRRPTSIPHWLDVGVTGLAVTDLIAVPSAYRILLDGAPEAALGELRRVIVAGEPCPPRLVADHYRVTAQSDLYNEYGPTEATVWATVHLCTPAAPDPTPIGRPIPGTTVHVLDSELRPVPEGAIGELFISGPGLAQGYLHRTELTAERFLDALGESAASVRTRLYRTGDLVRERGGELEFVGRADHQVKISGYRVELDEIAAVVARELAVDETVAVLVHDSEVVCFVRGAGPVPADIRQALSEQLPGYMVPSRLEFLPDLPHLPNGKTDRAALSRLASTLPAPPSAIDIPSTLRDIWTDILGAAPDAGSDFFGCGGDSIDAIRFCARAQASGIALSPRDVFRHRTLRALSAAAVAESSVEEAGL